MTILVNDVKYGVRMFGRKPGFACAVMLTLGLGIGINSALFSVIYTVLLKPLPYAEPDRLIQVESTIASPGKPTTVIAEWSYPRFELFREHNRVFESIAACAHHTLTITQNGEPDRVEAELVSADYFPILGLKPQLGRVFEAQEDRMPGSNPVAVISHGLWQHRFGGQTDMIGKTVCLNKVHLTVIGIMPAWFRGQLGSTDVWVPIVMTPVLQNDPERLTRPMTMWHRVIGRLNPGISLSAAQAAIAPLEKEIKQIYPMRDQASTWGIQLTSLQKANTDPGLRRSLLVLFGAVGFVLVIACVNVASLLLARGMSRDSEIMTRMALGATRTRIVRQLLVENLVLSIGAGVFALFLAHWGIALMAVLRPADNLESFARSVQLPDFGEIRLGIPVLLFNFILALACVAAFGLVPALRTTRRSLASSLRGSTEFAPVGAWSSLRLCRARSLLVVWQTALALVLLTGAGLMMRSFARLINTEIGFEPGHLLTMRINKPQGLDGNAWGHLVQQIEQRITSISAVKSACVANAAPLSGTYDRSIMPLQVPGPQGGRTDVFIGIHKTSPGYLNTLQVPLLAGRWFTEQDIDGAKRVAVINAATAQKYFSGTDPVGRQVDLSMAISPDYKPVEIVGVVGDVKYDGMSAEIGSNVYVPCLQSGYPGYFLIVRTVGDPMSMASAVRSVVTSLDRDLPVTNMMTMKQRIADSVSRTRFIAVLLGLFAGLALLLAVIGLYGLMACSVVRRTREFGIRIALGACPADVLRLTLCEGIRLLAVGGIVGLTASFALTRLLQGLLYEVSSVDPLTFAIVLLLLALVGILACYIPARRAAKANPMEALRYE